MKYLAVLRSQRLLAVLFMGFASGLPLALTGSTLQAWFAQSNVSMMTIGVLSLVGIPYLWKFVWSPALDRFTPPWGGRRRGWVMIMQLCLCAALFLLSLMDPNSEAGVIGILALVIAFLSASQDIGVDAYRTEVLHAEERGLGAATYIFAYRMAMLLSGGLALILADHWGWRFTYEFMAVLMGLSILATYKAPEPSLSVSSPKTFSEAVINPFKDLWGRDKIVFILLFLICYKLGDCLALALMSKFLISVGFSLTTIGLSYKTAGLFATILGAFVGGSLLVSINLYRALLLFGLAQAFSNLMFVFLSLAGKNTLVMVASIFIENFCSGMSTAAFVALLMTLCHVRYTATQMACLSAFTTVGRVLIGPLAAWIQINYGWVNLYWIAFILSFPGLGLLMLLQHRINWNGASLQEA